MQVVGQERIQAQVGMQGQGGRQVQVGIQVGMQVRDGIQEVVVVDIQALALADILEKVGDTLEMVVQLAMVVPVHLY